MSIITLWNESREQVGQTYTAIAIATQIAIERNNKILLFSTSINDSTMKKAFLKEEKDNVMMQSFNKNTDFLGNVSGIEGIQRLMTSKKLEPEMITDYSNVILKDRLEVLPSYTSKKKQTYEEEIHEIKRFESIYIDLIKTAEEYYDLVIVDLDKRLNTQIKKDILKISNININVLSQKKESLIEYLNFKNTGDALLKKRCIPVIAKYFNEYKYNSKNVTRFLKEKEELNKILFNLKFMEAAEDSQVIDLFLRMKNIKDHSDENYIFMESLMNLTNNIFKKIMTIG